MAAQRPALEKARLELASDRSAHRRGETARIAAIAQVEQGWHIQSHTPSLDYLIPTVLTLDLPDGWADAKIEYPPHRMWTAQFEPDQPLAVYEGRVRFLATVEVPGRLEGRRRRGRGAPPLPGLRRSSVSAAARGHRDRGPADR